ncbi:hypothetical protein E5360_09875 [Muribaculum intestinale]|uniref:hypothetical protein n=1 Tax=Muribaculum intestinale TaxID=1796646 RepID=UPI00109397DA|nr:hypothetical protein [Muribaculum intestinale]TGX81443.1 hypothetical protein E5360_09875 [Muribaculum intestinale]
MLVKFISNLSQRFRSENDLSDVTWTMCQTSDRFQRIFLQFFFPNLPDDCSEVWIGREDSKDDSRPDFIFYYKDETYLIENKIGDKNHHFEQYVKTFKIEPAHLGYIANYPIAKDGFQTHTWRELFLHLSKNVPEGEKELWTAYLEYIKDVCCIFITEKPMNLQGMFSLYTFYRCLDDVFVFDNDAFSSALYDSLKDTNGGGNFLCTPRDGVMGKYFSLKLKKCHVKKSWGWLGVYFDRMDPVICLGFCNREDWGKPVFNILNRDPDAIPEGNYASKPYEEDGAYWFDFKKNELFNDLDLDGQVKMLREFFQEAIMAVYNAKIKS